MSKQAKPVKPATVKNPTITLTATFDAVYSKLFAQAVGRYFKAYGRFYIVESINAEGIPIIPEVGIREYKFTVELRPIDQAELGKPATYKRVYGLKNQLLDLIDSKDSANK